MQVFVKAAQEAFGDTTIDVEKLMDMMQKGQLKAAKLLPFVAKYYAEAARKGDALGKAMRSNRVAMQQMSQAWVNFQNAIFDTKFGEVLTDIFRDIAHMLSSNGELGGALGDFLGNLMEGFWESALFVHDTFVFLSRMISYYLEKIGIDIENFQDNFNWVAYAAGVLIFVGAVTRLYRILKMIAGLRGGLTAVRAAVGGSAAGALAAAPAAGTPGGPMGPPAPGGPRFGGLSNAWKASGIFGKAGILGTFYSGYQKLNERLWQGGADRITSAGGDADAFQTALAQKGLGFNSPGLKDVFTEWFGYGDRNITSPTISPTGPASPSFGNSGFPFPNKPQQVTGNIDIKIDAGEMKNMVQAVVDENNMINFNLLLNGGA